MCDEGAALSSVNHWEICGSPATPSFRSYGRCRHMNSKRLVNETTVRSSTFSHFDKNPLMFNKGMNKANMCVPKLAPEKSPFSFGLAKYIEADKSDDIIIIECWDLAKECQEHISHEDFFVSLPTKKSNEEIVNLQCGDKKSKKKSKRRHYGKRKPKQSKDEVRKSKSKLKFNLLNRSHSESRPLAKKAKANNLNC